MPASSSPGGAGGAPGAYTEAGPPDKMIADAPGDELGVLGPEVHHENRAGAVGVVHRVSLLGSRSRSTLAALAATPTR